MLENKELDQEKFDTEISEFEWQFCETPYISQDIEQVNASILAKEMYEKYTGYFFMFNKKDD